MCAAEATAAKHSAPHLRPSASRPGSSVRWAGEPCTRMRAPRSAARSHSRRITSTVRARWAASGEVIDSPFGRQHQIVQAGDGDAGIGGGPAQLGAARGRQDVRLVTQRERRDLQAVVADGAGERALALEGQLPDHLVAERDAHGSPSHAARSMSEAFSAIMMVGALVLPPMSVGMTEASTT